ncbi:MAG: RHS repeat-associated core domain-containing protein [Balneolia bacterium]|nr:RHS repeat-associated core domain-containing protein [Balneolia bacterium]
MDDELQMKSGTYSGYMRYYYLKDHLGSVRVTLNQSGSVVGHDDYYPFGLQMPGRSNNSANRDDDQKFTGHFFEQEGDLEIYHAQARMYDPAIGRFMGVDAMRSEYPTINPYHYTLNNPLIYTDPTGMYVVSRDGTYVTRVQAGHAQLISGAQNIPGVGGIASLVKMGETAGDPSINMNAADYLNLATLGTSGFIGAVYRGARNVKRAERTTLRTMKGSKEAGATAIGFAFTDAANLFIDEQIFNTATKLGLGQANIANRGFFNVSDRAKDLAEFEGSNLNTFVNQRFSNIEKAIINIANDSGFDLNNRDDREQFRTMLRSISEEEFDQAFRE